MPYLLYYAGMADDKQTEQIGLATSVDGLEFTRLGTDGLLVPIDPAYEWRSVRTCNPTVVEADEGWVMYFQGIGGEALHTSIGRATSTDGVEWTLPPTPCISWTMVEDAERSPDRRTMVFEPSVLRSPAGWEMWFLYSSSTHTSNTLFRATSPDGATWRIDQRPLLSGDSYGRFLLHYPQVLREGDGYRMFFTLRSRRTDVDTIWTAESADGSTWGSRRRIAGPPDLPLAVAGRLRHLMARTFPPSGPRLAARRQGRSRLGISHPHVLDGGDGSRRMYFHEDHAGTRGRWMDIGVGSYAAGRLVNRRTVLAPTADPAGWDSYFVADPFVVEIDRA